MTPGEVHGLQALAVKHGGSLTINPETGLPEAGFLSSILPMLAGLALAPLTAGTSLAFLGSSALSTALTVGGITGLATGSLKKGLMAGIGAWGGFGLGEALAGAGSNAMMGAGINAATTDAVAQTGLAATQAAGDPMLQQAIANNVAPGVANATPINLMSKGFSAATASPSAAMDFAKANFKPIAAALTPMAMDALAPKTPMPTVGGQNTGQIVEYGPDGQLSSMDAGRYNKMGLNYADLARGYSLPQTATGAGGGIVALNHGGMAHFDAGGFTNEQVASYIKDNKLSSDDARIAAGKFGVSEDQLMQAQQLLGSGDANLTGVNAAHNAYQAAVAGKPDLVAQNADFSTANNLTTSPTAGNSNAFLTASNTGGIGLPALDANLQNYAKNVNPASISKMPGATGGGLDSLDEIQTRIRADMAANGVSEADMQRATGKTVAQLAAQGVPATIKPAVAAVPASEIFTSAPTLTGQAAAQPGLASGVSGTAGAGQIGGGTVRNQETGMIVESPRIPGIPVGGFTGAKNMRDIYETGGGSLGYTPKVPASYADFLKDHQMQGGSKEWMDYLMGKGPQPSKPYVAGGGAPYQPYMGAGVSTNLPYTWDKATQSMVRNPDYVAPKRDAETGAVSYGMSVNEIKKFLNDPATAKLSGQELYDWMTKNNASAEDVARARGVPASAVYSQIRDYANKAASTSGTSGTATLTSAKTGDEVVIDTYEGANGPIDVMGTKQSDGTFIGTNGKKYDKNGNPIAAAGGMMGSYAGGGLGSLGGYSDGGRLLRGPGDGVSDDIPATIGDRQPARLADGEFVVPARIVSELGNGSTEAGARKLYQMMDRVQHNRRKSIGKGRVATNSRSDKFLPA